MTQELPSASQNGFATTPVAINLIPRIVYVGSFSPKGTGTACYPKPLCETTEYIRADIHDALVEENKRLREACEWYASDEAWTVEQVEGCNGDYGRRAKQALAAAKAGE